MFGIGLPELVVIMVVALLIFGPAKLPELARSLGRGLAEFRRASSDLRSSVMEATQDAREPFDEVKRELQDAKQALAAPLAKPEAPGATAQPSDAPARPDSKDPAAATKVTDSEAPRQGPTEGDRSQRDE